MTSQRWSAAHFRSLPFALFAAALLLSAAVSRGLAPEEGVVGGDDVIVNTWSALSCSEAQVRCDIDITCRVLLETIDKVCDQSGTIQHCITSLLPVTDLPELEKI